MTKEMTVQDFAEMFSIAFGGKTKKPEDVEVVRGGTQIILPTDPKPMTEQEAITHLERKVKQNEMEVRIVEEIDAFPLDGAYSFMNVLKDVYGWAEAVPTEGFFGTQNPPQLVSLEIAYGKYTQILWGQFQVPGIEGTLHTGGGVKNGTPMFVIIAEVKRKYEDTVKTLAQKVREYVKKNSIYKGKAFKIFTESGVLDGRQNPKFLDLSGVNPEELVLPENVAVQVQTGLFAPIEHTEECRKHKIPLKIGVLLEGPYGTGKTLTAFVTAQKAQANGWTFIYLDKVAGLKAALDFAKRYAPAVIFSEDIDRVMSGERDVSKDDILNTIDGVDFKGAEIITVLTTNDVEKINKAMIRPGRLDVVISFEPMDSAAAQKLVRLYARELLEEGADLTVAGEELKGQIPALIREAVERSKRYAVSRGAGKGKKLFITGIDVAHAARSMKKHMELLKDKKGEESSVPEQFGKAYVELMTYAATELDKTDQKKGA